jgi:hypothetical protein
MLAHGVVLLLVGRTAGLSPAERLAGAQGCLEAVGQALHLVMDDVNMSTFFHRWAGAVPYRPWCLVVPAQLPGCRSCMPACLFLVNGGCCQCPWFAWVA